MLKKTNAKNISGVRNNWFLFHLKKRCLSKCIHKMYIHYKSKF